MGEAIVATHCVPDVSALTEQLTNLQFGEPAYYLLQRSDAITDWKKGTPDAAEIKAYTHGRLFGSNGEIRWQESKGGYSLLWLSEGDLPDGFTEQDEWETSAPQNIFLLGGGDAAQWQDTRIPRKLCYPIDKCQYPSVKVIQYKERNSQTIRFTRYTEFVGKQGD
jgi:hypothetical protein